jgi:hypothetical protein
MWTQIPHSIEFRAVLPGIEYADIRTDINFHTYAHFAVYENTS